MFNPVDREFEFKPGAIFANIVIADEINRSSPKTQSALLEAMEEGQVTVDGQTHPLPEPFLVVATQNPLEMEGTYALPEAQRDRFMMRISMGYPDARSRGADAPPARHRQSARRASARSRHAPQVIAQLIAWARAVHVAPTIEEYAVALAQATRTHPDLRLGASPRATLQLVRAAKVWAALDGRGFVIPDDITALLMPVFAHRLIPTRVSRRSARPRHRRRDRVDPRPHRRERPRSASPRASEAVDETPLAADRPWNGRARARRRVLRRRERGRDRRAACTSASCWSPSLGASVVSLYLTRRSDTVARSLSPDVATVGRDALVTVRVGVRTALPTAPGTWRDTHAQGSLGAGARGLPGARLGPARQRSASSSSPTPSRACGAASTRSARCR